MENSKAYATNPFDKKVLLDILKTRHCHLKGCEQLLGGLDILIRTLHNLQDRGKGRKKINNER